MQVFINGRDVTDRIAWDAVGRESWTGLGTATLTVQHRPRPPRRYLQRWIAARKRRRH